jgi:hypothetical protein
MSGLETLPPDQRAVLQLILRQGRGYADLAGLLKIDADAVRDRAHAGVRALGGAEGAQLAPEQRARIADYVLGQQDDAERIVTLAELESSSVAAGWARALHARIAPLAAAPLPEVPPATSTNGVAAAAPPAAPEPAAAPATAPPPPPPAPPRPAAARPAPRPSRLGGAILLAAVAALAVVLVVLLSSGGGDSGAKTGAATTSPPATSAQTQPSTTGTTPAAQPTLVAQANLKPTPAGGKGLGVAIAARSAGKLTLALEAQHLPANGSRDFYGIWLQGSPGTKFLGYAPQQVKAGDSLTVSAQLPANLSSYRSVLVAHEPTTGGTPRTPGLTVLSGNLTFVR